MTKPKSEAWYAAMHARKGKGTNQYTKAKELGLPKPELTEEVRQKLKTWSGKTHSEETKKKISDGIKKAHTEGRAWNIGSNRWLNQPSYPEKFFMLVIENEFADKKYEYNKYFNGFWLDFAWKEKKKCIEIDGKQHYENAQQIERDKRKNKLLEENGWGLLRINWDDMYNDPKKHIQICKEFIDS